MSNLPVVFQLLTSCCEGKVSLFEMEYDEFPLGTVLITGLRLINIPGMPNVVGPDVPFDNQITLITWCGHKKKFICSVHGVRYSDRNLEEIKADLPEWRFIQEIPPKQEQRPGDMINDD